MTLRKFGDSPGINFERRPHMILWQICHPIGVPATFVLEHRYEYQVYC
jgi:hypothetical protein